MVCGNIYDIYLSSRCVVLEATLNQISDDQRQVNGSSYLAGTVAGVGARATAHSRDLSAGLSLPRTDLLSC